LTHVADSIDLINKARDLIGEDRDKRFESVGLLNKAELHLTHVWSKLQQAEEVAAPVAAPPGGQPDALELAYLIPASGAPAGTNLVDIIAYDRRAGRYRVFRGAREDR